VDKGTSQTDWLEVEKERGISVRSASASFEWNNYSINLIDTPGHVDFSAEVERTFRAMDCAILVLSAVEGVQAHSQTLWEALRKINLPILIFINKIDRSGSDTSSVIEEIKKELISEIIVMQDVNNEGNTNVSITNLFTKTTDPVEETLESILNQDESLLLKYLNNEVIQFEILKKSLTDQIQQKKLVPVFMGSAKFDVGLTELMEAITVFMPVAIGDSSKPLSGIVYKVEHDKTIGRMASVRLFNGSLKNRDTVPILGRDILEKVSQIRKPSGQKFEDTGELTAGDAAVICGLSTIRAGDIIGDPLDIPQEVSLANPLLTARVYPTIDEDYSSLVAAMQMLTDEDPSLSLVWMPDERELHIKIRGAIQLEILKSVLLDRFRLQVTFGNPTVIYKETPALTGEGYEEYTMPKPCWAVVLFRIEPGEPGSGVQYESKVGVNKIAARYQNEIERTLPLALQQGILGWEVTDLKITLIDGEHHNIHSRAGDFAIATPMALMNGLKNTGTRLLEPILNFTISAPEHTLGKIASNLTLIRAEFGNPEITAEKFLLSGVMPVSTSMDFPAKLSSITGGKGKFKTRFSGYRECPVELGTITEYRGISPLDRAKYILKARKAIQ
jgi:ribosomal protection tetracycline resistance protein